ncbi:MAG: hypothetical protein ACRD2P_10435, partial [Terriglobia bacterium]
PSVVVAVITPAWLDLALFCHCRSHITVQHYELLRRIEMKTGKEFTDDKPDVRKVKTSVTAS